MKIDELDLERFADAEPIAQRQKEIAIPIASLSKRLKFLSADGQQAPPLEQEAVLGIDDRVNVNFIDRCQLARSCVGRIQIIGPGRSGSATGFLIAPGIILTNHHVFPTADSVSASRIGFDYWYDIAGAVPDTQDEFEFDPERFYVSCKALDFAAIAVSPRSRDGADIMIRRFLRMIPESGKAKLGEFVTIFQHPNGKPMQVALRENEVVRADASEPYIWYRADTAHGSSGAPVLNDSFQLVALHSGGRIKRDGENYVLSAGGVAASIEGLNEDDVVWEANAGYRISHICSELRALTHAQWPGQLAMIESAMREGDIMSSMIKIASSAPSSAKPRPEEKEGAIAMPTSNNTGAITIPLNLQIRLTTADGTKAADVSAIDSDAVPEALELRTPVIYDGLTSRPGFNRRFLGGQRNVPMPLITPAGRAILAPLINSASHELKYRHFSVWMHRERRLALLTAANVDWRDRQDIVEGKATNRDALAGWPGEKWIAEQWVDDPRLAPQYQLPDSFYNDDRGAFDKGHLVRRDDACWGTSFEEIQMANGDTFHVTNCSPQTEPFNQSAQGRENWGDLENAVAKLTKNDKQPACLYAGPIFAADDRWFRGRIDASPARIQIPSRYWKIVVVKEAGAFQSFGFVLDQDIRAITETEFAVTSEWMAAWKPIKFIENLMRGWLDFTALKAADQHPDR